MPDPVRIERAGDVLVIIADNPPVNALSATVRKGIEAAVKEGVADASIVAMVIRCEGRTFYAGSDITEFGKPPVEPVLAVLVNIIEASDTPIVAAIHGTALGGGCEVALASHYRIAARSAKLGFPEVKLGLLPGAGGTQRLPRLIGVPRALEMIAKGDPISAEQAQGAGLVDKLCDEDELADAALAFAREIAGNRPIPRASERATTPDPEGIAAFRAANAKRFRGYEAPAAAIACIEKASGPFAEGIAFERQQFATLVAGEQSAAQRYLFFATRQAAKIDDLPDDVMPRSIKSIGVIGVGTMGRGIATTFLSAGLPVTLIETEQDALDRGADAIRSLLDDAAKKGRLGVEQVERAKAGLTPSLDIGAVAGCDLVIEAVFENMAIKKELFGKLDGIAKPGAILATNTSYLDIDEIAAATARPADVIGLHFFSPANVMKLLEVVRAERTGPEVLATATALAKRIGKIAVVAGVAPGFIGNRMLRRRQDEAMKLLLEGASPEQIDKVHTEFGMPMGPFRMSDLAGVDIGWHRDPARADTIREALCAEQRWGQKTGAGWYDYDDRGRPSPSPRTAEIIDDFRNRAGTPQHDVTNQEIVERTLYPMVNEGAAILAEGKAQRASDIDVAWVNGYGWPAWRGGPMYWADREGLEKIVTGLERQGFVVTPLLREKAERGERFTS